MRVIFDMFPVAISGCATDPSKSSDPAKRSDPSKHCVIGIITDTSELTKNGLYQSKSVMPPDTVQFWLSSDLANSFKSGESYSVTADVSVRNNQMAIVVREVLLGKVWYSVKAKLEAEDLF